MIECFDKAWKAITLIDVKEGAGNHIQASFNGFVGIVDPARLPWFVRHRMKSYALLARETWPRDRELGFHIEVHVTWGTRSPPDRCEQGMRPHFRFHMEDVTASNRRAHRCRRAATIMMSYKLCKFIPQRDLRLMLGSMVWKTHEDSVWEVEDTSQNEEAKRAKTE